MTASSSESASSLGTSEHGDAENSEITAVPGRPFQRGQSGNPGGRPRVVGELRSLARQHAPAAIEELARLAMKAKSESVRVAAIRELFDRGYGRAAPPSAAIELSAIGEWNGIESVLSAYRAIIEAVTGGHVSPAEGLELVALIETQRAAVKELLPSAMYGKPTAEQLAEQKKRDEKIAKLMGSLLPDG